MNKFKSRSQHISPKLLSDLAVKIERELGLSFSQKLDELEKRVLDYSKKRKTEDIYQHLTTLLQTDLISNSELIDKLVVPESYFFRNQRLFNILEKHILPRLIHKKKQENEPLKIWSAGCSGGQEPYSIAILLHRMMQQNQISVPFRILGTDINETHLNKAKAGIYSQWSFRNVPIEIRTKYFRPLDQKHFELDARIRKMVEFEKHNLLSGTFPPIAGWQKVDLILCRNVLIYFDKKNIIQVLQKFYHLLSDDGYFIPGPAEIPSFHLNLLKPQIIEGVVVYRKLAKESEQVKNDVRVLQRKKHPHVKIKQVIKINEPDSATKITEHQPDEFSTKDEKAHIKWLADNGKLQEACNLATSYCEKNLFDEESHFLLGTIHFELGNLDKAETCFRRVLYLNPSSIMAQFYIGNIKILKNDAHQSARYLKNVLDLLYSFTSEQEIPLSAGLTAGQMTKLVNELLSLEKVAN